MKLLRILGIIAALITITADGIAAASLVDTWIFPAAKGYPESRLILKKNGGGYIKNLGFKTALEWSPANDGIFLTVRGNEKFQLTYDPAADALVETIGLKKSYLRASKAARLPAPKMDPRFVGTWRNSGPNKSHLQHITFKKDGTGEFGNEDNVCSLTWTSEADTIRISVYGKTDEIPYDAANETLFDSAMSPPYDTYRKERRR